MADEEAGDFIHTHTDTEREREREREIHRYIGSYVQIHCTHIQDKVQKQNTVADAEAGFHTLVKHLGLGVHVADAHRQGQVLLYSTHHVVKPRSARMYVRVCVRVCAYGCLRANFWFVCGRISVLPHHVAEPRSLARALAANAQAHGHIGHIRRAPCCSTAFQAQRKMKRPHAQGRESPVACDARHARAVGGGGESEGCAGIIELLHFRNVARAYLGAKLELCTGRKQGRAGPGARGERRVHTHWAPR